ncbi:MAG TPA: efflux RND transporter periplasmic adaptor subunit [Woeseiaceae bacterium]|nr:efflux RND transporter periplasmic adaptor subunit [Woeseiaceae bacterium]
MRTRHLALAGLILLIGIGAGYGISRWLAPTAPAPSASNQRTPLYYRNPMNPEVTSAVPTTDSMGMDYLPVYADDGAASDEVTGTVRIDPVMVQNIGVRTATAEIRTLTRDVFTVGRVDYDEQKLARIHPKIEGWVEELFVDQTGMTIAKDAILLDIYAPQMVVSQEEYLLALRNLETLAQSPYAEIRQGAEQLAASARQRLLLLDMPPHQLHELEQTREVKRNLHIHSPFDGIVVKVGVRGGQFVTPQTELHTLADLSTVWVYVDIYEYEMPWVAAGDAAELHLAGLPDRLFEGRLDFVYPYLDKSTRTQKVRLVFANPDRLLKPEMYGDVTIRTGREVDAVVIPTEAVIRSGRREQVFVLRAPGKYEPRPVTLGVSAGGLVQITDGLAAGEQVVVSGQFLIDSESKLREVSAKFTERQP